jgi:plastocyanin
MIRLPGAVLACVALAFAAGCGSDNKSSSSDNSATPPPADTKAKSSGGSASTAPVVVTMQGNQNSPADVTVKVGQKIDWENKDGYAHTVTSTKGAKIDSGNFTDTFSYAPKTAGTITYICTIHAGQGGTITVTK